jgi:hypothetical protein
MCYNSSVAPARSASEPAGQFPDNPTVGLMSAETSNQETLVMAAGALLSLAFSYTPGLGERYAARTLFVSALQKGVEKKGHICTLLKTGVL